MAESTHDDVEIPAEPEQWALVDIYGHDRYAGRISEAKVAGASMLRIDVPETPGCQAFSKLFGAKAIFSITPCDERVARAAAVHLAARPLIEFSPPPVRRLPNPDEDHYDADDEDRLG